MKEAIFLKVLFAAPDRDLLECYKELLKTDFGEIVTAFDGAQVLSLIASERFDLAILDSAIPRVDHKTLVMRIREKKIPILVLTDEAVSIRKLMEEIIPNAYLTYPFDSAKICSVMSDVLEKASSGERMTVGDIEVLISEFRIKNGSGLTANEINVLKYLANGKTLTVSDGAYISALNDKFQKSGSKAKIRYKEKKGFELVTCDE